MSARGKSWLDSFTTEEIQSLRQVKAFRLAGLVSASRSRHAGKVDLTLGDVDAQHFRAIQVGEKAIVVVDL